MSTFEKRKQEVKAVLESQSMTEDRFWELVTRTNWPHEGYDRPKLRYLQTLKPKEGKQFRAVVDKLWAVLDRFVGDRNPAGGGDDSHSDLMYHIIGIGKDEFYACLKSYKKMEAKGHWKPNNKEGYVESFGYAVPYKDEWDDPEKEIECLMESIERRNAPDKIEIDTLDIQMVLDNISETLSEADGDFVAEIYNKVCSEQVEYDGDDGWKIKETT